MSLLSIVVVVALAWGAAAQCVASTISSCIAKTCCGATGGSPNPPCEWVPVDDGYCACSGFSCCYQGCVPQSWSQWSSCSVSCGAGTRSRSLAYNPPVCGGMTCETNYESENCYPGACPTNCQVSSWSGWTCSTTCGGGTETRSRYITVPEANGGSCPEAGSLSESRGCDAGCCPQNCNVGGWSSWGGCSSGCGPGSRSRSRSITPASCGGSCSESETTQSEYCDAGCCASNCVIGGWSAWGGCSAPCGGGSQSRSRSITPASCGGSCSISQVSDSQSCNTGCCPQHCQVGTWGQWSACSQQCGGGTHTRTRAITAVAACGGNACPTDLSESEPCGGSCCAVNCVLGQWTAFSACSVTCGSGTRSRTRVKQSAESCGGSCDVLSESETCTANGGCCPVDCVWSAFGAWSGCSVTCGAGTQTRTRSVQSTQSCGGSCAGTASETMACIQPACALPPVDCEVSQWAQWSACTATCGATASKSRTRTTTRAAANGGTPCPSLSESVNCGFGCCPVACIVSTWSSWAACSATCGSGTRARTRTATTDASCGGTPCPSLGDSEACSTAACATDCQLSMWSNWSTCSQACGTGEQRRTRSVVAPPANGGAMCGALSESQPCTRPACACGVSAWSNWSPCSVSCGGGTMSRSRNVTMAASDCPPLSDSVACSTQPCARDCVLAAWSAWSACSVSCGGGRRERTRAVAQAAVEPGMACPLNLAESEQCGAQVCTAPGLACSEYTACTDCTDNGKTSPRACQFCGQAGSVGLCQSLLVVDGNATSGLRTCPIGLDSRATSIAACAAIDVQGGTGSTAAVPDVVETVDIRSALKLSANETTALADVTLSNGVRLQVRVVGEDGAMLRALEDGGVGAFSPSRDGASASNATNMQGRLRAGLSMEFLFAKDRPVSFKRLVLGAWDATDEGQLEIGNDKSADGGGSRRRDMGAVVMIRDADSSFEAETAAGYTKYVLSANGESDFSVKLFMFTVRGAWAHGPAATSTGSENIAIATSAAFLSTIALTSEETVVAPAADSTDIALIAGTVCGAVVFIALIVVAVAVFMRSRRKRAPSNELSMTTARVSNYGVAPPAKDEPPRCTSEYGPIVAGSEFDSARVESPYAASVADLMSHTRSSHYGALTPAEKGLRDYGVTSRGSLAPILSSY